MAAILDKEQVLLKIDELEKTKKIIRQGTIAKALSNGQAITKEMINPFISDLGKDHLLTKLYGPRRYDHAKLIPVIALTAKGRKMIEELKNNKN